MFNFLASIPFIGPLLFSMKEVPPAVYDGPNTLIKRVVDITNGEAPKEDLSSLTDQEREVWEILSKLDEYRHSTKVLMEIYFGKPLPTLNIARDGFFQMGAVWVPDGVCEALTGGGYQKGKPIMIFNVDGDGDAHAVRMDGSCGGWLLKNKVHLHIRKASLKEITEFLGALSQETIDNIISPLLG